MTPTPTARTRHVLYIEDSADNVHLVERLLRSRPDVVLHVATNGRDGIDAATTQPPDLILLDNHLPDATGSEVLRRLAEAGATVGVPVVIVTGDPGGASIDRLHDLGASELLTKPFDIGDFLAMVDRQLA